MASLSLLRCFLIISTLELGAAYVWSSFTSGTGTPDTIFGSKRGEIILISAALLNVLISYAAAWRTEKADCPEDIGELIRRRCKGRIKYISEDTGKTDLNYR